MLAWLHCTAVRKHSCRWHGPLLPCQAPHLSSCQQIISQRDFPRASGQEEQRVQKTQLSLAASTARPDLCPFPTCSPTGFSPCNAHFSSREAFLRLQKQTSQIHTNTALKNTGCHMEPVLLALAQDRFICREREGPHQFHQLRNSHRHHQPILFSRMGGPFQQV